MYACVCGVDFLFRCLRSFLFSLRLYLIFVALVISERKKENLCAHECIGWFVYYFK